MAENEIESAEHSDLIEVDLKNPLIAAALAWFWPGAGHMYQRRYAKGALFMICILGTFFFGMALGGGRVVYASFGSYEEPASNSTGIRRMLGKATARWHYGCQIWAGAPALPALLERVRADNNQDPLFGGYYSPPDYPGEPYRAQGRDKLAEWHLQYKFLFEMGTLYTVIAGLLNVLAIYDAYSGPYTGEMDDEESPPDGDSDSGGDAADSDSQSSGKQS